MQGRYARLPREVSDLADYFDDCRRKRNQADYIGVGYISDTEARYLLEEAKVHGICWAWTQNRHPALLPTKDKKN
jgi:hypothetical protein